MVTSPLVHYSYRSFVISERFIVHLSEDGDSFAPTSFTALLPRISGAIPGLRLVAYVRESEVGRFEDAWRGVLAVELLPQADELDYTRLGAFALAATKVFIPAGVVLDAGSDFVTLFSFFIPM